MKRTITLNISTEEMEALEELCSKKGLNKTAILKQALKLYQLVDHRVSAGDKLVFENDKDNKKSELMML